MWSFGDALLDAARRAYVIARREVFDVTDWQELHLTTRQQQTLVDLEVAEDELRQFRARQTGAHLAAG